MIRSTILFLTFTLLLLTSCNWGDSVQLDSDIKSLQDSLSNIKSHSQIPGFAVAIVKGDAVIYCKGFGYANIKEKRPYTAQTIQPIASISKTFIGLALMKAIDQGHFTLETDINNILPFKIINPYHPDDIIKIKHLVTHTSGLVDNDSVFVRTYTTKPKPEVDFKTFFKEYYTSIGKRYSYNNFSNTKPGEQFNYSNIAAALVAYLIELKSGLMFPEYTSKYIFEPLHMLDTHWFFDSLRTEQYSTLYEITNQTAPEYKMLLNSDKSIKPYTSVTYPDGKLYSTMQDMTKYLVAMVSGHSTHKGILSPSSFQTLFAKQFNKSNTPTNLTLQEPNRAIFWAYDSKGRITHTGSDYGLTSFILFDPRTNIGRILLFNTAFDGADNEKAVGEVKLILTQLAKFENKIVGR